jgi:hypothetical protein
MGQMDLIEPSSACIKDVDNGGNGEGQDDGKK